MTDLRELLATRVLFQECAARRLGITVHENLYNRVLEIDITEGGVRLAWGTAVTNTFSGFPICLDYRHGTVKIADEAGLRQFMDDLTKETERYQQTDRRNTTTVAMCVKCLRTIPVGFVGRCECGQLHGEAGSVVVKQPNYPYGVALEDSKPIPGTNPVSYEPVTVSVNGAANTHLSPVYKFPSLSVEALAEVKALIRAGSEQMIIPRSGPLEMTICGNPVSVLPVGSAVVVTFPSGDVVQRDKLQSAVEVIRKDRPDLVFLLLPDDYTFETRSLDELQSFRDRLNEVIYDRENRKATP